MLMLIDLDSISQKNSTCEFKTISSRYNRPKSTFCKIDQMDNQSVFDAVNIRLRFTLDKQQKQQ